MARGFAPRPNIFLKTLHDPHFGVVVFLSLPSPPSPLRESIITIGLRFFGVLLCPPWLPKPSKLSQVSIALPLIPASIHIPLLYPPLLRVPLRQSDLNGGGVSFFPLLFPFLSFPFSSLLKPKYSSSQLTQNASSELAPSHASKDQPSDQPDPAGPAVRFKSTVEEISPETTALPIRPKDEASTSLGDPGQVSPEQLRALSKSLMASPLQERRMSIFGYEAFSLPASRVCTNSFSFSF